MRNLNIEHTNQPTLHSTTTVNWSILGKLRWFTWSLSCNSFSRSLFNVSCSFEMFSVHWIKILCLSKKFSILILFLFESITNYLALIVRKIIVRPKVNLKLRVCLPSSIFCYKICSVVACDPFHFRACVCVAFPDYQNYSILWQHLLMNEMHFARDFNCNHVLCWFRTVNTGKWQIYDRESFEASLMWIN